MLLEEAYRNSSYIVFAERGSIVLRVGEPASELDEILKENKAREWAFVTAYNPRSMNLPDDDNKVRQASLEKRVLQYGYKVLKGEGAGDSDDWSPEPSLLIIGIPKAQAEELGRLFEQNAVLVGTVGRAPELLWCMEH
jgi:hypothetical protein